MTGADISTIPYSKDMFIRAHAHLFSPLRYLVLLLWAPLFFVAAQPADAYSAHPDSTQLTVRHIPDSALRPYLEDPAFQYDRPPAVMSLWDQFVAWFWKMTRKFILQYGTSDVWEYVFYGAAILFAVWLVYQIFQSNFSGVLHGRSGKDQAGARILNQTEDIHEIDYERAIQDAIAAHQYRMAVRLYYLHILKILSVRHQIDWKMDKTNHDYLREMTGSPLRQPFAEMTLVFESAWYGDKPIDETAFQQLQMRFQQLQSQIVAG